MTSAPLERLMVFTGNANPELALGVARHLGIPLGKALVGKFSDGECQIEIEENVRGQDVFVIQPTSAPTAEYFMEKALAFRAMHSHGRALNALLPGAIWVSHAGEVANDFHPRYGAVSRHYIYRVGIDEMAASPFHRRWCWPLPGGRPG